MFLRKPNTKHYLIIGLGNIGKEYTDTRHNIGFMFLDYLEKKINLPEFSEEKKFFSLYSKSKINDLTLHIAKPTTYMNLSGKTVRQIKDYFNIPKENILIIHDDLDIDFGKFKIQSEKGPREHNGIKSIKQYLKSNKFYKIRIGIENRGEKRQFIKGHDYVLSKFTEEEKLQLDHIFEKIWNKIFENWFKDTSIPISKKISTKDIP